ncbi:CGNR zinc finger domain-containing protein [Bradyrhizobium jicamae]|uniref:CGNR zinc finger domain-containing protein n=1 Tax=Bradyrhizobium jicamae TaxID=280332 RepID=UPI001BA6BEC5|nr:CGNR zinc finger domain-containing protein [Bradyrhizobium jicamae]MBR0933225.1 CGNR zinc finger domain-containing protein [Bradyrhizobium jicamae]
MVCEESLSDIRPCEGPDGTLVFVDHTRARARRWCGEPVDPGSAAMRSKPPCPVMRIHPATGVACFQGAW